jgi:excisionase family DNA binding protein
MYNTLEKRLDRIENLLRVQSHQSKVAFNMEEASVYTGISKSTLYKLTSRGKIPYSQPGNKLIWFKKSDLDDFMLSNRRATTEEIQAEAISRVNNQSKERSTHVI